MRTTKFLLPHPHLLSGLLFFLASCGTDYASLPIYSNTGQLQAVISVPAGSNHQMRYDPESKSFVPAKQAGDDQVVDFLPYPGNYGFIPSTLIEDPENGEGHAVNILVIAESVPTGTVMEVVPLGTLLLDKKGVVDYTVVAVPAKPSEQIISATDYATFSQKYPAAKDIVQKWLAQHNPQQRARVMGWKDEVFTEEQITRWMR
jgi:inorganic pyrophosphatase